MARSRWLMRSAALFFGALPSLAFPEPGLWIAGFVGLVPLLLSVITALTRREAAARSWLGGIGFFISAHHWLFPKVGPFIVAIGLVLGLSWIPAGVLAHAILAGARRPWRWSASLLLVPSAWVGTEFVRSWEGLGGPWGLLGAGQWQSPFLALAALGGVWLVSFALVAINLGLAAALMPRRRIRERILPAAAALLIAIAGAAYGLLQPDPQVSRTIRVGGVQTGDIKGHDSRFRAHLAATGSIEPGSVDLVVWGESSVGFDAEAVGGYLDRISGISRSLDADVLVNVDARRGGEGIFKSALLVGWDGPIDRYDKMRLVPFGEYIPLRPALGWLTSITDAANEDRRRGAALRTLRTAGISIGPLVCFESSFPDLSRALARLGADLIVVQSATTTFQNSWAPEQHASLAAVRAVESGVPVLHATLSGVSAAFDASGKQLLWFGTEQRGAYVVEVPLSGSSTFYARHGDWVPYLGFTLLSAPLLLVALKLASRRRRDHPATRTGNRPTAAAGDPDAAADPGGRSRALEAGA